MNELIEARKLHCANCATPLEGEFCHHCGQSVHSVLKPVHHMLEDSMDMFLHVDGRILHTLPPLLGKPGYLTLEYFGGRRQRYVAPFRLMFVLCLLAFFAVHLAVDAVVTRSQAAVAQADADAEKEASARNPFADARTPQQVQAALTRQLAELEASRKKAPALAGAGIDIAERGLREAARKREVDLGAKPAPASSAARPGRAGQERPGQFSSKLDGQTLRVGWLPDFMNQRLELYLQRTRANFEQAFGGDDAETRQLARERLITGVFSVLPQAMVVMIPLFALLLKLFYLFRRRLYMEHLIVALHSHAFLFLALLLATLLGLLSGWLRPHAAWAADGVGYLQTAALLWMPAYLLVMQKRVYRQGWPMTLLKYWCVGWCYFWLLTAVLLVAALMGAGH